jgi:hypothetical protein
VSTIYLKVNFKWLDVVTDAGDPTANLWQVVAGQKFAIFPEEHSDGLGHITSATVRTTTTGSTLGWTNPTLEGYYSTKARIQHTLLLQADVEDYSFSPDPYTNFISYSLPVEAVAFPGYVDPNTQDLVLVTQNVPDYAWILTDYPSLFTEGRDNVDFNHLQPDQITAVKSGADLYHTLAGNDIVTLPTFANAANLGATGVTYNLTTPLVLGDGLDSVYGGDANANIDLGTGKDTVFVSSGTLAVAFNSNGGRATIDFTGKNQTVIATIPQASSFTVSSFGIGDVIDLPGSPGVQITAASPTSITLSNGDVLKYGGATAALIAKSDGNSGTEITTPGTFDIYIVRALNGECSVTATENGIAYNVNASSLGLGASPTAVAYPNVAPGGLPIPAAYDDASPIDPGVYSASLYATSLGVTETALSGSTVKEAILLQTNLASGRGVTSGNGAVSRTSIEIHRGNWTQDSEGCIVMTTPQLSNLITPIYSEYAAAYAEGLAGPVINVHVSNQSSGQYQAVVILGSAKKTAVSASNIATYSVPVTLSRAGRHSLERLGNDP